MPLRDKKIGQVAEELGREESGGFLSFGEKSERRKTLGPNAAS